jgi:molecular chaperone GrpE
MHTDDTNRRDETVSLGSGVDIVRNDSQTEDDIALEELSEDGESPASGKDIVKKLRERIKTLEKERQEYLDGWQRLKADFANYKRRESDERGEFIKFAREGLITELLPVLESFQLAFKNREVWEKVDKNWRTGVEYIHAQLARVLADSGLEEIVPTVGEPFTPSIHTSIGTVATDDPKRFDTIAEVVQPGYRLNGKVIRSPKVHVYAPLSSESEIKENA